MTILVVDDETWHIWCNTKQWLTAGSTHKDIARKYWHENRKRLGSQTTQNLG